MFQFILTDLSERMELIFIIDQNVLVLNQTLAVTFLK
jgi:hypothetical protein